VVDRPMVLKPLRAALAWAALILVLCLMPGSALPTWEWADLISLAKLIHAVIFGILMVLLLKGFAGQAPASPLFKNAVMIALVTTILYGCSMELLQQIPGLGRRGDILDVIANTAGAFGAWGWVRWRSSRERQRGNALEV